MLVKGINQRKHYSEPNSFNARLNVFVSICFVGRKALWQLSQRKSQSNHHKISLILTRVGSFTGLKISWYHFSYNATSSGKNHGVGFVGFILFPE